MEYTLAQLSLVFVYALTMHVVFMAYRKRVMDAIFPRDECSLAFVCMFVLPIFITSYAVAKVLFCYILGMEL